MPNLREKSGPSALRVLLFAESSTVQRRLEQTLEAEAAVQVVASANSVDFLSSFIGEFDPDVILWHADGRSDRERMQANELYEMGVPLAVIVEHPSAAWISRLLAGKVFAMLGGNLGGAELAAGIQSAAAGLMTISPNLAPWLQPAPLIEPVSGDEDDYAEHLTARERHVLEMMMEGLTNKEIAARLKVSTHTVKFHISSILGKLGASSRTEAATIGLRRGLITI